MPGNGDIAASAAGGGALTHSLSLALSLSLSHSHSLSLTLPLSLTHALSLSGSRRSTRTCCARLDRSIVPRACESRVLLPAFVLPITCTIDFGRLLSSCGQSAKYSDVLRAAECPEESEEDILPKEGGKRRCPFPIAIYFWRLPPLTIHLPPFWQSAKYSDVQYSDVTVCARLLAEGDVTV